MTESDAPVSLRWLVGVIVLIAVALAGFWGRSLAEDVKITVRWNATQDVKLMELQTQRVSDREMMSEMNQKLTEILGALARRPR